MTLTTSIQPSSGSLVVRDKREGAFFYVHHSGVYDQTVPDKVRKPWLMERRCTGAGAIPANGIHPFIGIVDVGSPTAKAKVVFSRATQGCDPRLVPSQHISGVFNTST